MQLAALALSLTALASGAKPVVAIEHTGPAKGPEGTVLEARMVSTGGRKVFEPAVFIRIKGEVDFRRLPLEALPDHRFRVVLPAELSDEACEYFLEAFDEDGNGPFRKGGPNFLLRLNFPPPQEGLALKPAKAGSAQRTAGIALVGGGAALIAGGLVFGHFGYENDAKADLDSKATAENQYIAATALLAAGAVATTVGAILWATSPSPAPAVTVSAAPVSGGAMAILSGSF